MLFSDPVFFAFFLLYFPLHLSLPSRLRIYLVIVGSTVFYAYWRTDYVWLPYAVTLICWLGAKWMECAPSKNSRKQRLILTIVALFLPLVLFKYAHFFAKEIFGSLPPVAAAIGDVGWLKIALPLAVSFMTFTLTAYVVDVYRRRYKVEEGFTTFLGYVLFFPHLIAGPILRPNELMPQLRRPVAIKDARYVLGTALFALGLVKKLVFADTMAGIVEEVFKADSTPTRAEYILAIYGYSIQIYCDFSGYTDMAIGLAYVLGIRLPTNFMRPYTSELIIEFWRLWHITLSHWLRDYLYIPLGGNRLGTGRQFCNIMITMVLGGLWHGANWTFLVWGFLHGLALAVVHRLSRPLESSSIKSPKWLAVFVTFHFVTLAWIYFRSPDLATAHRVLLGPFTAPTGDVGAFAQRYLFELLLLIAFFLTHRYDRHARVRLIARRWNRGLVLALVALAFLVAVTVSQGSSAKFIYFDF